MWTLILPVKYNFHENELIIIARNYQVKKIWRESVLKLSSIIISNYEKIFISCECHVFYYNILYILFHACGF